MWTRKELKETGKAALKANYWPSVLVAFILSLLTAGTTVASRSSGQEEATDQTINQAGDAFQSLTPEQQTLAILGISAAVGTVAIVALLLKIFLFNPLKVGCYGFFKENVQNRDGDLNVLKSGFGNYGRTFLTLFLTDLFIMLWALLLIIPGIVKSYSYRMVPYIVRDDPELEPMDVIRKSRNMMNGQKWAAFKLDLSFILWFLLEIVTLGLAGLLWVNPYVHNTNAALYLRLRGETADIPHGAAPRTAPDAGTLPDAKPEWEL